MKKIIIITGTLLIFLNCIEHEIAGKYSLGNDVVDKETYENALPYINADSVKMHKYPFNSDNKIVCKLPQGQKINITRKTIETDTAGNEKWPWYWVTPRNGECMNYNGWVYGKYISFVDDFNDSFWKLDAFSRIRYNRSIYAENLIKDIFGEDDHPKEGYSIKLLEGSALIDTRPSYIWYMRDSGFTKVNTYKTYFGKLVAFVNEEDNKWDLIEIRIDKNIGSGAIKIGMRIDDLVKIFGDDYVVENDLLRYNFDPLFKYKNCC